ncbi:MAG: hypothetical protein C0624_04670, partial [Desulfuromonas sp.]
MKKLIAVLCGVLALLVTAFPAMAIGWTEVDAADVKQMMEQEDPLVIFPLSRIEFNDLHIVDSLNIPLGRLEEMLPPDRDRKL